MYKITTNTLGDHLKNLHPANLCGVVAVLFEWAAQEFSGGQSGRVEPDKRQPLFEKVADLRACMAHGFQPYIDPYVIPGKDEFEGVLKGYAALLTAVEFYLRPFANESDNESMGDVSEEKASLAWEQIRRLGFNIGITMNCEEEEDPTIALDPIENIIGYFDWHNVMNKSLERTRASAGTAGGDHYGDIT
jgi:hypothetical protein